MQGERGDLEHVTHDHSDEERSKGLEAVSQQADCDMLVMRKHWRDLNFKDRTPVNRTT